MGLLGVSLTGVGITTVLRKARARIARVYVNELFKEIKATTPQGATKNALKGWKKKGNASTGKDYTIFNNVSYIGILDKGRHLTSRGMRGSNQAPNGMTKPAMRKIKIKK